MDDETYQRRWWDIIHREWDKTIAEISEIYGEKKEDFEDEDLEELMTAPAPEKPEFPILILSVAIFKDMLDIPSFAADIALAIGTSVSVIISLIGTIVLFIWFLGKFSGAFWKKGLVRKIWEKLGKKAAQKLVTWLGLTIIIENIPFLEVFPAMTLFVFMAYYREKKVVRLANLALEKIHQYEDMLDEYIRRNPINPPAPPGGE